MFVAYECSTKRDRLAPALRCQTQLPFATSPGRGQPSRTNPYLHLATHGEVTEHGSLLRYQIAGAAELPSRRQLRDRGYSRATNQSSGKRASMFPFSEGHLAALYGSYISFGVLQ